MIIEKFIKNLVYIQKYLKNSLISWNINRKNYKKVNFFISINIKIW